jgi:hypothetical protein
MARRAILLLVVLALLALTPDAAGAIVHAGDVAPDFHKTDLNGIPHSLYQYRGKVVVLFLLGYS